MKWSTTFAALSALASPILAQDLLFLTGLTGLESTRAVTPLGFTTKIVTEAEWKLLKTSDFASYKAIIIGDQYGSSQVSKIKILEDTKDVWGPAVQGNIIIHGADQSNHGKTVLIDNSIKFAASGKTPQGAQQTGLYFSLSQYYDTTPVATVGALSYFGTFEVRGQLSCYDKVHIVASSPSIDTLTDASLSNWGCSVHEAFSVYPTTGLNGFQAIAIADGVVAPGTQQYAGGKSGLPYIITRGATPAGCGDNVWDAAIGEECDDGNTVDGDGCTKSCKCESGLPKGDGTCYPSNTTIPYQPSGYTPSPSGYVPSSRPSGYLNSSTIVHTPTIKPPFPTTPPFSPPPYVTPKPPTTTCIGVEIIVSVTVTEVCSTVAPGTTLTYTTTVPGSTYQKPIYNTLISSFPCYVCAFKEQGIPTKSAGFITATTTHCPSCPSPIPATIQLCPTCSVTTLTATVPWAITPTVSEAAYTSYGAHTQHVGSSASIETIKTVPIVPTGTPTSVAVPTGAVQFTGGAAGGIGGAITFGGVVMAVGGLVGGMFIL